MNDRPLPDDFDDREFARGHRLLRENPASLTDQHLAQFLLADGANFAERAAQARAAGVPPPDVDAALSEQDRAKPASMGFVSAMVLAAASGFRTLRVSKRLLALEEKVRALDAAGLPHYEGIHETGKHYRPGSLCTKSGGLWLAEQPTDTTPDAGATPWRLVVKRGDA